MELSPTRVKRQEQRAKRERERERAHWEPSPMGGYVYEPVIKNLEKIALREEREKEMPLEPSPTLEGIVPLGSMRHACLHAFAPLSLMYVDHPNGKEFMAMKVLSWQTRWPRVKS